MMAINEMARAISGGGLVMFEDAAEDVTIDDFALFASSGAEARSGDAIDVTEAAASGFVNQRDGVRME